METIKDNNSSQQQHQPSQKLQRQRQLSDNSKQLHQQQLNTTECRKYRTTSSNYLLSIPPSKKEDTLWNVDYSILLSHLFNTNNIQKQKQQLLRKKKNHFVHTTKLLLPRIILLSLLILLLLLQYLNTIHYHDSSQHYACQAYSVPYYNKQQQQRNQILIPFHPLKHRSWLLLSSITNNNNDSQNDDNITQVTEQQQTDNNEITTMMLVDNNDIATEYSPTAYASLSSATFGESVSLRRPETKIEVDEPIVLSSSTTLVTSSPPPTVTPVKASTDDLISVNDMALKTNTVVVDEKVIANNLRRRNSIVAIISVTFALLNYIYQYINPIQPIQLLAEMEQNSIPLLSCIGTNNKPTIIEFWAPWCENCKVMAPSLYQLEEKYHNDINFISLNGDNPQNYYIIEKMNVDAIPHIAFISSDGYFQTSLIGLIPQSILKADIDALILNNHNDQSQQQSNQIQSNQQDQQEDDPSSTPTPTSTQITLPYEMFDAFANKPIEDRKIRFVTE